MSQVETIVHPSKVAPPTEIIREMWDRATKDERKRHKNGRRFLRFKVPGKKVTYKWVEVFWRR